MAESAEAPGDAPVAARFISRPVLDVPPVEGGAADPGVSLRVDAASVPGVIGAFSFPPLPCGVPPLASVSSFTLSS